ncbi:MAG: Lipoprotein signal peptidase [Gemmatimonadetes bacterium]|nr:Lipoprotein signal peptidase [Gemmatimonadota bacterium]
MRRGSNALLFWPVIAVVAGLDIVTKAIAVRALVPQRVPHEVLGNAVRFTLVYNPGAAFGLHLGDYSRWIFTTLTIVALVILGRLFMQTREGDRPRVLALALVCAGAIGNLLDRLRSDMGVVDFLDVGIGTTRWPTFNIADMAVSTGAVLLAWVLWQEDLAAARPAAGGGPARSPDVPSPDAGNVV